MMKTDYDLLIQQAEALTKDCPHLIANLANISALLYNTLDDINWAGFYLMEDFSDFAKLSVPIEKGSPKGEATKGEATEGEIKEGTTSKLILGPFQGNPACIEIPLGKGVCGIAALEDQTQLVPDVHQFPGHIACDSASRSEIVIPIHKKTSIDTANYNEIKNSGIGNLNSAEITSGYGGSSPKLKRTVIGVLDIDSPSLSRFTEEDQSGLEALVALLEQSCL